MTRVKFLELRDRNTFIPVVAIDMTPRGNEEASRYLLRRAGYGYDERCILLTSAGGGRTAQYDPYNWGDRTFQVAHFYIQGQWDELKDGDVVDVEFVLGETSEPKTSERGGWSTREEGRL